MKNQANFDVVIVGAGPAGCGMASGLLNAGIMNIALIAKPVITPFRIGESANPDVTTLLAKLGLEFDKNGHQPYTGNLVCWGSERIERHDFLFRGQGNGWHLDRGSFDEQLKKSILSRGVTFFSPDWIQSLSPWCDPAQTELGWEVQLHSGRIIRAKVIVDASGRNAVFTKHLGIKRKKLDSLIALACRVPDIGLLQGSSFINSSEIGWWYAVNLPDGHSLVSLMTDTSLAKKYQLRNVDRFRQLWTENVVLARYIPSPQQPMSLHTFAAYTAYSECAAGKNWLAIGDALMSFDPLTSSGISNALSDALVAVPVVVAQLQGDLEPAYQYAIRAHGAFQQYMKQRTIYYTNESRWKNSPFWSDRSF